MQPLSEKMSSRNYFAEGNVTYNVILIFKRKRPRIKLMLENMFRKSYIFTRALQQNGALSYAWACQSSHVSFIWYQLVNVLNQSSYVCRRKKEELQVYQV